MPKQILCVATILFCLFSGLAAAQAFANSEVENFDSDTAGANPAESWYSYDEASLAIAGCSGISASNVVLGGLGGSANRYDLTNNNPTHVCYVSFNLNAALQPTSTEFRFNLGSASASQVFIIYDLTGREVLHWTYLDLGAGSCNAGAGPANCAQIIEASGPTALVPSNPATYCPCIANVTFNWTLHTYQVTIAELDGSPSTTTAAVPMNNPAANGFKTFRLGDPAANRQVAFQFDQWIISATGGLPERPDPVPGLNAVVTQTPIGANHCNVDLRWLLSPNDPNQTIGQFSYHIWMNGVDIGADTITAADGDGIRFNRVDTTAGPILTFQIQATNTTSGQTSDLSDSVTVDCSILGDSDSAGQSFITGGSNNGNATADTANGLKGVCSGLIGASNGSLFICGLILAACAFLAVVAAFGAFSGSMGLPALIGGLVFGLGVAIFDVVAGIWSLGAAALMAILATGIVLALLRKQFFGRRSGSDGDDGDG